MKILKHTAAFSSYKVQLKKIEPHLRDQMYFKKLRVAVCVMKQISKNEPPKIAVRVIKMNSQSPFSPLPSKNLVSESTYPESLVSFLSPDESNP